MVHNVDTGVYTNARGVRIADVVVRQVSAEVRTNIVRNVAGRMCADCGFRLCVAVIAPAARAYRQVCRSSTDWAPGQAQTEHNLTMPKRSQ